MDLNLLSPFPEWEGEKYDHEEGEEWKCIVKNELAKKLYNQWLYVYMLIESLCDNLPPSSVKGAAQVTLPVSAEYLEQLKATLLADASIIPYKISGAEAGDLFVLRMENASIIRKTALEVYVQCSGLKILGIGKNEEIVAVLKEIISFRKYFVEWVSSFETDQYKDEWGLYQQNYH